jgi:selenide,water dikinase
MESMKHLNGPAAEAALAHGVRACTDITGFGLAGHALEMARGSGCLMRIQWKSLPLLPGTLRHIEEGIGTAMARSNRRLVGEAITFHSGLERSQEETILDPQTSGGLLLSVDEDRAGGLLQALGELGPIEPRVIGRVLPSDRPGVELAP